jgi:hypothetical protein
MKRDSGPLLPIRLISGLVVSVACSVLSGCGSSEDDVKPAVPVQSSQQKQAPVVVDWYPAPKVQKPQLGFAPQPGQPGMPGYGGQWGGAQNGWPANPAQSPAGVPQAWVLVPATGYYAGQAGGANTSSPVPGTPQQVTPWNAPAPQAQVYYPQQIPQQTYGYPPQTAQQPVQQPYQYQPYQYPAAPQTSFVQRPWGQYNESASGSSSQNTGTWQKPAEPPAWGSPGYVITPVPGAGYYGGYPGTPLPGFGW